jgi:hypothetical protein
MLCTAEDSVEVYYVPCPNDHCHWILFDPESTLEPKLAVGVRILVTRCTLCGPGPDDLGVQIKPDIPLRSGWVTDEERDTGWTLEEPRQK